LLQSKLSHLTQLNEQIQIKNSKPRIKRTEKLTILNMGLISAAVIAYSDFLAWSRHQKQIQRDADAKHSDQREANEVDHLNRSGQFDDQHMQATRHQRLCIQINKNAGNGRTAT
jgi:hypothetical protein